MAEQCTVQRPPPLRSADPWFFPLSLTATGFDPGSLHPNASGQLAYKNAFAAVM